MTVQELQVMLCMYDPGGEVIIQGDESGVQLIVDDGEYCYELACNEKATGH